MIITKQSTSIVTANCTKHVIQDAFIANERGQEDMRKYTVCLIDGYTLKFNAVETEANTAEEAGKKVFAMYGNNFEHRLTGIYEHD